MTSILELLRCPACTAELREDGAELACLGCARRYEVREGIPLLVPEAGPGMEAKRNEIAGWVALAREQGWYEPDDAVDLALPFVCRDLGWDDDEWRANEFSFGLLLERYVRRGMRVLEVGAGKCWAAQHLVPLGCEYVGTDLVADSNIGLGRGALYERRVGPFPRVQADGERLPFADDSFDLVFCVAALHHAVDLDAMVAEMARVVRRGGVVAALNEGTRPLARGGDAPQQAGERAFGINEHVHTLPAYLWALWRAGLVPVRLDRSEGYALWEGRRALRVPGGRTALTALVNLFAGYSAISLFARRMRI
jgi:SAM-dependent methyltransferase/uncharacterized protein YbaR (Trm112 family)